LNSIKLITNIILLYFITELIVAEPESVVNEIRISRK
jgi:hypothetical protein